MCPNMYDEISLSSKSRQQNSFTILLLYRVSTGTAHGFGLFDYAQKKEVFTKCTLNPSGKINVNYHE